MIVLQGAILALLIAGWGWLAFVGIPNIVAGVQEVRDNWDNPDFWGHPDDDDYWDNELNQLLLEENDPAQDWEFLNEEDR